MGRALLGDLRNCKPGPEARRLDQYSCSEQYGQNLGVLGRPEMFCPQYGQVLYFGGSPGFAGWAAAWGCA